VIIFFGLTNADCSSAFLSLLQENIDIRTIKSKNFFIWYNFLPQVHE